jgi:hypothetical protein
MKDAVHAKPAPPSFSQSTSPDAVATGSTPPLGVVWMEVGDPANPFGVRVVNCLPVAHGMLSTTKDRTVAERYTKLRSDDGRRHCGMLPQDALSIVPAARLAYPFDGQSKDGPLFVSSRMEEKWDAYLYNSTLYFSRSWTGDLAVRLDLRMEGSEVVVERAYVAHALSGGDPVIATRVADYFVKTFIYRWPAPHPLPRGGPEDANQIALLSFALYGAQGIAATFDDTVRFREPKRPS